MGSRHTATTKPGIIIPAAEEPNEDKSATSEREFFVFLDILCAINDGMVVVEFPIDVLERNDFISGQFVAETNNSIPCRSEDITKSRPRGLLANDHSPTK